ncbi:SLAM family member 9 [Collichthys lucidus]|uniref:SLAM family member 9 n=1 Tax=Collichthys lucidus TaxID=240159 RepID=A0A4U5UXL9_COLLU|nr:SLAM family member 9 [Collichthys lucidus]
MSIFVILGLLLCIEAPGSSAVTPVFVKKGDDLLLNVTEEDDPQRFIIVVWKFRGNTLATFSPNGKTTVFGAYTGRVETSVKTFSVKLNNLQEADSGVYTAQVLGRKEQTLIEYDVTVQAPVSPVGLTVDSVSSSSDSCNLTVTCSTQDSHISSTLTCDTQTCSQEGGERSEVTTSGASLRVYLETDSIICNHSNQVSWTKNMTNIQDVCPQHAGSECVSAGISVCLVKTVVFSVGLVVMVSAVITVHIMEKLKKKKL